MSDYLRDRPRYLMYVYRLLSRAAILEVFLVQEWLGTLIARQAQCGVCFEVIHTISVKYLFFLELEDLWNFESNIYSTLMILRV